MSAFEELIYQVDQFIRKYYKNQMIKGAFLFLILFLSTFLLVSGLEFLGQFNSFIRAFLFFSFVGLNGYVLTKYFLIPLFKLFSFGERISRIQAAKIIGEFFPSINDKLVNTLQLEENIHDNSLNLEFVQASIQQNAKKLNTFSFISAIDYASNKKFLSFFLPILFVVILAGIFFPKLFKDGTTRVINFNQVFEIAPDFIFNLENTNLLIEEGKSILIEAEIIPQEGKAIPNSVYIITSEGEFVMRKNGKTRISFLLENLSKDVQFHFKAANNNSKSYLVKVAKRTSIGNLSVDIDYPKYLGRNNEKIDNPGDLILPEGTKLTWNGTVKNSNDFKIISGDTTLSFKDKSGFRYFQRMMNSSVLTFVLTNNQVDRKDTNQFFIDVIKDEYPHILLNSKEDSIQRNKIYFSGNVSDDYGLSRLIFSYEIKRKSGEIIKKDTDVPGIDGIQSNFSMYFDINQLPLELEDELTYFFTVYDNDGVNGSKGTRSTIYQYISPSQKELQEQRAEDKNKSQEQLKELTREAKELNEQIEQMKKELLNSKSYSYQQQKQMENLKEQQESLQERLQKLKDDLKSSFDEKQKLSPSDQKLLEKQEQLEKMLEQLMDPELLKLLEELEKMLKENQDKNILDKLNESEMSSEQMEKQLDRTMEMLKIMDVQERVEDLQKNLLELAKEQDQLREDLKNNKISKEDAQKKQEELNKDFNKLQNELKEMMDKNDDLKRPYSFDGLEELSKDISKDMQDAKEQIDKGNNKNAQSKQKDAGDKMEQAASQLQAQTQQSQQEQDEEDVASLRMLLKNLLKLSFDQEANMSSFESTSIYDPFFVTLGQEQRNIMDNFKPVQDSLRALANRIPQISSFIEQELTEINKEFGYIPDLIGEREKRALSMKQQFVMMHLNNLALFLNESLEQKQKQMQSNMPGSGNCSTPGGSGKSGESEEGDMEGMKEMIKKQLEKMKNGEGNPGGQKPGGQDGLLPIQSKDAAKMAAEQSAMQKKLQELRDKLNQEGKGEGNQLNDLIKELEKQQESLINRDWNEEMIERQQEILTRLLESEKALKERGLDEKRESNSGKDENFGNQIEFLEYKRQKEKQIELLKTLDPSFSKYYKDKANAYFLEIN